jgi:hypothetical protein
VLDWRNRVDVAIIIVVAVVFGTVITSGSIVAVDSVVGVPAVISVVVFVRRPGVQETPCRWVLLNRLVVLLLFRGGVVPFPGHVVVIIFIFHFPVEEELEVLTIGPGLVVL